MSLLVELRGLTVPEAAFTFTWDLVHRGFTLRQDGEKLRVIGPGGEKPALSRGDVEQITRYKPYILALIAYQAPEREF